MLCEELHCSPLRLAVSTHPDVDARATPEEIRTGGLYLLISALARVRAPWVGPKIMIGIDSSNEVVLLPRLPLYERGKEPVQQMSQPAIHVWYEHELLPGIDSAHTARRHSRWLCAVSVRVNFSDGTTINGRSAKTPGNSRGNGEDEGNGGVLDSKGLVEQKRRAFRGAVKGTCWGRHKACK